MFILFDAYDHTVGRDDLAQQGRIIRGQTLLWASLADASTCEEYVEVSTSRLVPKQGDNVFWIAPGRLSVKHIASASK